MATDENARQRLLARIGDINDFSRPRPVVSLEEFFVGNDDDSAIGYNLPDPPRPATMFEAFLRIRNRPDVADVLVVVKDLEDPDEWPSTDSILVLTSASPAEASGWMSDDLRPDDTLFLNEADWPRTEPYEVPPGMRAVLLWWD